MDPRISYYKRVESSDYIPVDNIFTIVTVQAEHTGRLVLVSKRKRRKTNRRRKGELKKPLSSSRE